MNGVQDNRLVGAVMPLPFRQFLNLYIEAYDLTKADIIRQCLLDWQQRKKHETNRLIENLASHIQGRWEKKKLRLPVDEQYFREDKEVFKKFIRQIQIELKQKEIAEDMIHLIICKLRI